MGAVFCFLLFLAAVGLCILLGQSLILAIWVGIAAFAALGLRRGMTVWAMWDAAWAQGRKMCCVIVIYMLIGAITALWRSAGTIAFFIYHGLRIITPQLFLLVTFLLTSFISYALGTSFGVVGTLGVILMALARSGGVSVAITAGTIVAGAYFGDRCSPVSTSALLVSELTETNIYDNIKRMLKTALVPFLLSCGVYAALGMVKSGSGAAGELWSLYGREMTLHWVMCLPAVLILILSVLRVNVKKAMSVSILAAVVLCIFLRHLDAVTILKTAILGYTASDAEVGAMLNGGGIISMVRVALIVMISSAYSGIFRKTGLLDGLCGRVTALRDKTSPYASMLLTAVLASLLACNQTLTIILTHQLCAPSQKDKEEFAINLENSAVVVAPLIPWSIAGATPLSTVGAPMTGMAFACFLYILPLCELARRTAQQRAAKKAAAQK